MPILNLDNLTLVGPGSEWFWSAVSGLTVAATLIVIYRQMRDQRSASLYEQSADWGREWSADALAIARVRCLLDLNDRKPEEGLPRSAAEVGDYFERLATLVRKGHLRVEDVHSDLGPGVGWWWRLLQPYLAYTREQEDFPGLWADWENLEERFKRMDQKMPGRPRHFDVSAAARLERIEENLHKLRFNADIRNGIYPALPETPAASEEAHGD